MSNDCWRDDFVHVCFDEPTFQRAIKRAVEAARLTRRVTSLTYRHSFAMRLPESGYDIQTVQEQLGHSEVATELLREVTSPLENLHRT